MEELHNLGFYCPSLKRDDIAVMKKGDSISAKIFVFQLCDADKEEVQKNDDWLRLGIMLYELSCTKETEDFVEKLKNGQLKGQSILKHSALLTVRKKVQNALALNFYISVSYPHDPSQSRSEVNLTASEICVDNLESDLDKKLVWNTPACATAQGVQQTLRGFVKYLRTIFEHESKFVPPELTMKDIMDFKKPKDLDHLLQDCNGDLYVAVQMLVAKLNLEY
ncbi:hypothetical protein QOZ80_5BG0455610 [Eleusine coracana subsp. coracana]|nr:hypothetical protein QOZ80_5BG0455610 [Eleusine coracana subsp. coracana]